MQTPATTDTQAGVNKSPVRVEFGRKLHRLMLDKGWTQAELARRASEYAEKEIGRYSVSCYTRGITLPRPDHLNALARAFDIPPRDLLPTRGAPIDEAPSPLDLKDVGDGRVHLRVNQILDWQTAIKIMAILRGEAGLHTGE